MKNISVIIVAKDNPPYLFESVKSLDGFASQIIIIDIGIQLNAIEKLKQIQNVEIIRMEQEVPYVEIIREKTKQYAKHEYIFFLDPDEILSEGLKSHIIEHLEDYDYFAIPRKNIIFSKWIQHARWWPDYQIRLFKKDAAVWPTEIHKQPSVKGKKHIIPAEEKYAFIHYNYQNLDEYIQKAMRYAKAEAKEMLDEKVSLVHITQKALSEFISRFFAERGYRDGMHGFSLAFLQMLYYFLVYFYYWEMKKYPEVPLNDMLAATDHYFKKGLYESKFWEARANPKAGISEKIKLKVLKTLTK